MTSEPEHNDRNNFLKLAIFFQGGLMLVAMIASWLFKQPVWRQVSFSLDQIGWATIATLPMLMFLWVAQRSPSKHLVEIRQLLRDTLGKPLAACNWLELAALALLAGVSEECFFRGVLEPWCIVWIGPTGGFILCSVLFGACHAVTPAYAVIAAALGAYLSMTRWLVNEPNLLVPIFSHSLYDFIAFVVLKNSYRDPDAQSPPKLDEYLPLEVSPPSLNAPDV